MHVYNNRPRGLCEIPTGQVRVNHDDVVVRDGRVLYQGRDIGWVVVSGHWGHRDRLKRYMSGVGAAGSPVGQYYDEFSAAVAVAEVVVGAHKEAQG